MKWWGSSISSGKDKLLYRAIRADKLGSIIFYGPPGTGKTTLAKGDRQHYQCGIHTDQCHRQQEKKIWRKWWQKAKDMLGMYRKKTILFRG